LSFLDASFPSSPYVTTYAHKSSTVLCAGAAEEVAQYGINVTRSALRPRASFSMWHAPAPSAPQAAVRAEVARLASPLWCAASAHRSQVERPVHAFLVRFCQLG